MAYGQRAFRKIQLGIEATNGTAVPATDVVLGVVSQVVTDKVWHKPEQDRGVLAMNYETPFQVGDDIEFEFEGELYDDFLVFLAAMSIRSNVTPTQPDNVNEPLHYLWLFEPGMTTANTPDIANGIDTATIEFGDNVQAYETEFSYLKSIEITGEPNEAVMVTATFGGRQSSEVTFTGALTAPAAAYFAENLSTFFIDTSYAGIGGTAKAGMLRAWTWTFETGFSPRYAADGTFFFSGLNEEPKKVELELTYYRDGTNSEAAKDLFESQATTYLRIGLLSHTEMDAAQSNPQYVYLDGAFKYTEWGEVEDEDGTATVTVKAESFYDTTASKMFGMSIGTKKATL